MTPHAPLIRHPLRLLVPIALAFALACGGGSKTTPPPPPPPPPIPVAPTPTPEAPPTPVAPPPPVAKTFDQVAFQCCNSDRADRLVDKYTDVEAKLAAGDGDHVNGQYTGLSGIAQGAIDKGGYGPADNAVLKRIVEACTASEKTDLAGKRAAFKALSTDVITFARAHAGSGQNKIAQVHCAADNADWLQKGSTVESPYGGAAGCGSFQ